MKKIRELQGHGFYVLEGINSANTHLIENQRELDQFFIFADSHLRNYMTIYEYCVTAVGWNILVQINDEASILEYYTKLQERRGKKAVWDAAWLIVSNQIRLFRGRMTQWTNKRRKREGNASKTTYGRYMFTTLEEAQAYIAKVRNQEVCLDQPITKYRPSKRNYDKEKQIAKNEEQLSSKSAQEGVKRVSLYMRSLRVCDYIRTELENWVKKTCELHGVGYGGEVMQV